MVRSGLPGTFTLATQIAPCLRTRSCNLVYPNQFGCVSNVHRNLTLRAWFLPASRVLCERYVNHMVIAETLPYPSHRSESRPQRRASPDGARIVFEIQRNQGQERCTLERREAMGRALPAECFVNDSVVIEAAEELP